MRFQRPRRRRDDWSAKVKFLTFAITALAVIYLVIEEDFIQHDTAVEPDIRNLDSTNTVLRGVADIGSHTAARNVKEGVIAKNGNSLLNTYPASALPLCSATRISLTNNENDEHGNGGSTEFNENKPTIFTDWSPAAMTNWKDRSSFNMRYGNHPQYVKGGDVQPLQNAQGEKCTARTSTLVNVLEEKFGNGDIVESIDGDRGRQMKDDILFFTNDVENPHFIESIKGDFSLPKPISQLDPWAGDKGFKVFSAMEQGSSHPFHFHDAAWLGQVSGARLWYILPPGTSKVTVGAKVNGCDYLTGAAPAPVGAQACIQRSGEVFYLPPKWLHATCALEPWTVGVGGQGGSPKVYEQDFPAPTVNDEWTEAEERDKLAECSAAGHSKSAISQSVKEETTSLKKNGDDQDQNETEKDVATESLSKIIEQKDEIAASAKMNTDEQEWKWFDGNLGEYYDKLERDEHAKRKPNIITSYAVHRWMGPQRKTLEHYVLIRKAIYETVIGKLPPPGEEVTPAIGGEPHSSIRVFDGGCGLGAGLMWFEQHEPHWTMTGHTISEEQYKWITTDLPEHKFNVRLLTYDKPLGEDESQTDEKYHAIYSIEAAIHSPKLASTIKAWSDALKPGGIIVIIDDFLSVGVSRDDPDVDLFARSWIANSVHSTTEVADMAQQSGMALIEDRDLGSQYQIAKLNYRNTMPKLRDESGRIHQGWLGSKARQRLFLEGKITYRMIVLQKNGDSMGASKQATCTAITTAGKGEETMVVEINPTLMTGKGKEGGKQQECLSG